MSMLSTVRTLDLKHFENVKSLMEHVSLYVGLVVYTAAGAKVQTEKIIYLYIYYQQYHVKEKCQLISARQKKSVQIKLQSKQLGELFLSGAFFLPLLLSPSRCFHVVVFAFSDRNNVCPLMMMG